MWVKQYPSILVSTGQSFREFDAYIFAKLDGSNVRAEWTKKKGWSKFGTRTRLVDPTDPVFGTVPALFLENISEGVERIAREARWEHLVVFCEFYGSSSFAGLHVEDEPKALALLDVAANKRGLLPPRDFVKHFDGKVSTAPFLGTQRWTRGLVDQVRQATYPGMSFEGVVGKAQIKHELVMAKAKSRGWLDRVAALYGEKRAVEEGLDVS